MKILITGGGGFLGYRLALALLKRGTLADADGKQQAISQITLIDTAFPAQTDARLKCVKGDFTNAALLADAMGRDTGSVFHLAAVVSGGAEADFDLGIRVNLDGTRGLLEHCRKQGRPPRYVFTSSVAAFGGELPPVLDDSTTPNPAASSVASGIIREPLIGAISSCPVGPETGVWLLSPGKVVEAFIHAHDLPSSAWGVNRVVNLPGITASVAQMVEALRKIAGDKVAARVEWKADARIQAIVKTWPARFTTERALKLGFVADKDIETVIRDYIRDQGIKV